MKNNVLKSLAIGSILILAQGCVAYAPRPYPVYSGYRDYGYSAYGYPQYGYSSGFYGPSVGITVGPSYGYGRGWGRRGWRHGGYRHHWHGGHHRRWR